MTPEEIIAVIAPGYVGDPRLAGAITLATGQVRADHCQVDAAIANLAAHMLTLADRGGAGGQVISETEGGLSREFAAPSQSGGLGADALSSTSYGMELARLNQMCYGLSARTGWTSEVNI